MDFGSPAPELLRLLVDDPDPCLTVGQREELDRDERIEGLPLLRFCPREGPTVDELPRRVERDESPLELPRANSIPGVPDLEESTEPGIHRNTVDGEIVRCYPPSEQLWLKKRAEDLGRWGMQCSLCPNLDRPDETRTFAKGKFDVFHIGGTTIGRATYEPGWR